MPLTKCPVHVMQTGRKKLEEMAERVGLRMRLNSTGNRSQPLQAFERAPKDRIHEDPNYYLAKYEGAPEEEVLATGDDDQTGFGKPLFNSMQVRVRESIWVSCSDGHTHLP